MIKKYKKLTEHEYITRLEYDLERMFRDKYSCIEKIEVFYKENNEDYIITIIFDPDCGENSWNYVINSKLLMGDLDRDIYFIYDTVEKDWKVNLNKVEEKM